MRLPSKICVQYTHIAVKYREKAVCAEVSETCLDSPNSLYVRPLFSLPCLKPAHISLPCICFHYWPRPPSLHSLGWQPESTVEQGAYVYTICFSIKEKTCSLLLLIGAANDPIQHLSPASQHKNLYLVLCGEHTFRRTQKNIRQCIGGKRSCNNDAALFYSYLDRYSFTQLNGRSRDDLISVAQACDRSKGPDPSVSIWGAS